MQPVANIDATVNADGSLYVTWDRQTTDDYYYEVRVRDSSNKEYCRVGPFFNASDAYLSAWDLRCLKKGETYRLLVRAYDGTFPNYNTSVTTEVSGLYDPASLTHTSNYGVYDWRGELALDFNTRPGSRDQVDSVTVTGPDFFEYSFDLVADWDDVLSTETRLNMDMWWHQDPILPITPGDYTLTVDYTVDGVPITEQYTKIFNFCPVLPVESASMSADIEDSGVMTFFWDLPDGAGDQSYQVIIRKTEFTEEYYRSSYMNNATEIIASFWDLRGLEHGKTYQWFVRSTVPDCNTVKQSESKFFVYNPFDAEGDGLFDLYDPDDDNDGLSDVDELSIGTDPLNPDTDGDLSLDGSDPWPNDLDNDGINDADDNDWDNDGILDDGDDNCPDIYNADQKDSDSDGIGDACDNCRYDANPGQEDGDGDLLGDACDDPNPGKGIDNTISLPETPLNPGAPYWATAEIENNTGEDIQTLRPDCYNTHWVILGAKPLCRRGPAYGIPTDIVTIPAGGSFRVTCDISNMYQSLPPAGNKELTVVYENFIQDPAFDPTDPEACTEENECYRTWTGAVASVEQNIAVGSKTYSRAIADISLDTADWSAYYWTPSEESFITAHIGNIRDESNNAPLTEAPLTLTNLTVADVDLSSIKINGSAPCNSIISGNEIISTCPVGPVIASLGTVIPGQTIYPKIEGALRSLSDNEIYGYFSGSVQISISDVLLVSIDIKPGSYPNSINLKKGKTVGVGILSTEDFDATTVDPATVTLAGASVMPKRKSDSLTFSFKDLNRDGRLDLMLHFEIKDLGLSVGDEIAVLEGQTFGGTPIMGSDTVKIVK